jgi:hypothetical protein
MYAICTVVYGWDLTDQSKELNDIVEEIIEACAEEVENEEELGLITRYAGGNIDPYAFGITLCEFDECGNYLVSKLKLKASEEDKKKLAKLKIPKKLKPYLKGEPTEFLLWSSS